MEPTAISFKGNVRAHTHTHVHLEYIQGLGKCIQRGQCREEDEEGGKNRKPLYKLILGARRINTLPVYIAAAGLFLSLSISLPLPLLPPPVRTHIHTPAARFPLALCLSLSFGLIASVEKLFSSTLMNNTNGFSARQKLLRGMRSSAATTIAAGRVRRVGACARARNVCRLIANRTVARERDSINLIKLTLLVGLPIIPCNIHCYPSSAPPPPGGLSVYHRWRFSTPPPISILPAETYTLILPPLRILYTLKLC